MFFSTFFFYKSAPSTVCFIICLLFTSITLPLKNRHYIAYIITLPLPDESESFLTKSRLVCVVLVLVQQVDQYDLSGKDSCSKKMPGSDSSTSAFKTAGSLHIHIISAQNFPFHLCEIKRNTFKFKNSADEPVPHE